MLLQGHPDRFRADFVTNGLTHGFRIGFSGHFTPQSTSNLSSALLQPVFVSAHLRECIERGETAGPFSEPPLPNFVTSPIGLVPKKNGKFRLIHHLSAPAGESVNDGIPKEDFSLKYIKVDDAIERIMRLGRGALLAKFDIRRAFRLCPVHPEHWHLLGIRWQDQLYYDRVLPFGLRSAPFIFNEVADALQWICEHHLSIENILHLLDDFLLLGPPQSPRARNQLDLALRMCAYLGIPIADEKTVRPTTELTFLGIVLDTVRLESRLPEDKKQDLLKLVSEMADKRRCTLRELQHLLGKLNFASRVVVPGRTFTRRLYDTTRHASQPYHHVHLSAACRMDLVWWKELLLSWNGKSYFLEPGFTPAANLHVQTDAAGSIGYGAICESEWLHGRWSWQQAKCCITYQELYPIALACSTWGHKWTAKRIEFHTDNQAVAACVSSGTCRCSNVMILLRALFFVCAQHHFHVSASYVPGVDNNIADALSRQDWKRFRELAPSAQAQPTPELSLPAIPGEASLQPCSSTHTKP